MLPVVDEMGRYTSDIESAVTKDYSAAESYESPAFRAWKRRDLELSKQPNPQPQPIFDLQSLYTATRATNQQVPPAVAARRRYRRSSTDETAGHHACGRSATD